MSFIFTDMVIRIIYAILAVLFVALMLRVFDKVTGRPFTESYTIMKGDARALSIYYTGRFVGVCLLLAFTLS